jgi:ribosome biogenesis SPOUT family RNA methylase Rps3
MIEYIKEYGITNLDYEYIMHNVKRNYIELISLSEPSVRNVLEYYNEIGITHDISELIIKRPDLILISLENLQDLLSKIDKELFCKMVSSNIDDLILLGI